MFGLTLILLPMLHVIFSSSVSIADDPWQIVVVRGSPAVTACCSGSSRRTPCDRFTPLVTLITADDVVLLSSYNRQYLNTYFYLKQLLLSYPPMNISHVLYALLLNQNKHNDLIWALEGHVWIRELIRPIIRLRIVSVL